jgi:CBS domain-containing protein
MREAPAIPQVHQVMTTSPVTITADATVAELLRLFDRHDFNLVPVVESGDVLCGIVTKLEVLHLIRPAPDIRIASHERLVTTPVRDIMRRGAITVGPEDSVTAAVDLMVETRLRALPVVEGRRGGAIVVGIVSVGDLLRGMRAELDEERYAAGAAT